MTEKIKKSKNGCLWGVILLQGFIIIVLIFAVAGAVSLTGAIKNLEAERDMGADEYPRLKETWSWGRGDAKAVRIPLKGMILLRKEGGFFSSSEGSASRALESLRRATNDPDVKCVILDIDSGGGGITASDIIYHAVKEFKETDPDRKVVAVFGDLAASGAYYIAAAADYIVARPTTITGSIGVLMQSVNIKNLADKMGVRDVTLKSGPNKDMMNPLKDMTSEQTNLLQEVINSLYERFAVIVSENREIPLDEVKTFADGRIFTAQQALDLKLVDQIGYWRDALEQSEELVGENLKVFRYEKEFTMSDFFRGSLSMNPLARVFPPLNESRFMYLWQP